MIAALCLSGAAILPSAPTALAQRKTSKRRSNATVANNPAPTPTPAPTVAPEPILAPAKANSRPVAEQTTAPATGGGPSATAQANAAAPAEVRYYYEFTQPEFYLRHIQIEHDATGRGQMVFERKSDSEAYTEPLAITPAALARIMSAWSALRFLDSTENYQTDRQMAHLGTMRLRMTEGARTRTVEFNWTHNQQAAALTNEYRRLAEQTMFVFEVEIARQYQPSDTVKLLKGLESLLSRDGISDAAQLVPLLNDLANDERIPLIARNQAERLSKKITK
ncbi:MAG TPA: hypothetical protein VF525_09585 [Pyrinomonadaceae bacterium]